MLLFPDDPSRAVRMYLKQYYLCDSSQDIYLVKCDDVWTRVTKQQWMDSIHSTSGGAGVSTIIPQLENREACRRILI